MENKIDKKIIKNAVRIYNFNKRHHFFTYEFILQVKALNEDSQTGFICSLKKDINIYIL